MKKIILMTVLAALTPFLFFSSVEAKRAGAPKVEPLVYKGMKFIVPNTSQKMGYIEAWDIETNQKVWEKKVYSVSINTKMEEDIQWVFISSLKIEDGELIVSDERGKDYNVDIPKNMSKEDIQPLQLTIKSDKEVYEVEEEIIITGQIKNASKEEQFVVISNTFADFYIELLSSNGNPVPFTEKGKRHKEYQEKNEFEFTKRIARRILPEELIDLDPIILTEWFDITKPDHYFIRMLRSSKNIYSIPSNTITIEVVEKKGNVTKEEALRLVQSYIKENNISVKNIDNPYRINEEDGSWSITYEHEIGEGYEQSPSPFHYFVVDKKTGEISRRYGM